LTPLAAACLNNYTEIINLLLSKEGINVNLRRNLNGETALYLAASHWDLLEAVKLLLEREDIDINLPNNDGWTPLHRAIGRRNFSMVKLLLEREDIDINLPNNDGQTPLHLAITAKDISTVNLLLGKKAIDPNVRDNEGCTPLAMACMGYLCKDNTSIVGLLLSHCNTDPNPVDNNGVSTLTKVIHNNIWNYWFDSELEDHEKSREEIKSLLYAAIGGPGRTGDEVNIARLQTCFALILICCIIIHIVNIPLPHYLVQLSS
jgi:ankyrin repeat protein